MQSNLQGDAVNRNPRRPSRTHICLPETEILFRQSEGYEFRCGKLSSKINLSI